MNTRAAGESWWVVTDLDGTLMDESFDWSPAAAVLRELRRRGIPVIPCTSKTAEEVRAFRREVELSDPFIIENGGAVHGDSPNGEWTLPLGWRHGRLKPWLQALGQRIGLELRALDDLPCEDAERLTGLRGEALAMACRRVWSVPFPNPPAYHWPALESEAAAVGLKLLQGNRMAHLISADTDKGLALGALKRHLAANGTRVLALGDSPNDTALLNGADRAVVVPGAGGPHPALEAGIAAGRYEVAPAPHAAGWAAAVTAALL
jgi:mannosyl-3-phosphoglycerate phosphatase